MSFRSSTTACVRRHGSVHEARLYSEHVRVSVGLPIDRSDPSGQFVSGAGISLTARAAESAGFDAVFATDHPAPDAKWLTHGGHPTLDPFVALSFAAASTSRLKVHTNLMVLPYRNPLLAAKNVASLDVLSGGRLILGVGAGYLQPEFAALGVPFDDRAARCDDALDTMIKAWSGEPFDHQGIDFAAKNIIVQPAPTQRPHPPIWVGGNSMKAIERAVRFANGWAPMPSPKSSAKFLGTPGMESVDDLRTRIERLHELLAAAGRDISSFDIAMLPAQQTHFGDQNASPQAVIDEAHQLAEAGVTVLVVNVAGEHPVEFAENVAKWGAEILPHLPN
jgi:probable F420-dependent oxidoreductase